MEPILELKNILQRFGGLTAISDVSLTVPENEIVGLIGPNGAGKTTVFNVITGIYSPTGGKIFFKGKDVTGKQPYDLAKLGITRTFQNIRLFNELTVLDNVKIGGHLQVRANFLHAFLRLMKRNKEEKRITEESMNLLKISRLASYADELAGNLPYGLQRRLEIVRAMATGAKVILLDEPAAGMNEQETAELLNFIINLKNIGYTILLIEHDMKFVMNICDKIYVQDHGKIIASGTPEEIKKNQAVIDAYLGVEVE